MKSQNIVTKSNKNQSVCVLVLEGELDERHIYSCEIFPPENPNPTFQQEHSLRCQSRSYAVKQEVLTFDSKYVHGQECEDVKAGVESPDTHLMFPIC